VGNSITALLTYGPLGIFCAVLWLSYQKEKSEHKKEVEKLNETIQETLSSHAAAIDAIRVAQTEREREVSEIIKVYGQSVVTAVEQTQDLAERLWGIRK